MSFMTWFRRVFPRPSLPDADRVSSNANHVSGGAGATGSWQPETMPGPHKLPLGLRQNNPGNVRPLSGGMWRGQIGVANGFAVFATADEGIRAMALNLRTYQRKHGIRTLEGIVNRYAPAADNNNVAAYVKSLVNQTQWTPWQELDLEDRLTLAKLVRAVIKHEQGVQPFPPGVIQAAVDDALRA